VQGAPRSVSVPLPVLIIDLVIVALTLGLAAWGFSRGLTVGAVALLGFGIGAVLGSRLTPLVLEGGLHSTFAPILALPGALLVGGVFAALLERFAFRRRARLERLGRADAIAGALLAGCLGLVAAWLVGAVLAQVSSLRDPLVHSAILKRLNDVLPPPGPVLVARVEPSDQFPRFHGPPPRVARPDPLVVRDPHVAAAARSVVKVIEAGCGHGGVSSGWIAAKGVVVTNAHVVTGADVMTVRVAGMSHDATPIWFDARNDLALLRVAGIGAAAPLPLAANPTAGSSVAILGFPGGRWAIHAGRLGGTSNRMSGRLERAPLPAAQLAGRLITSFAGLVLNGSSGGAVVDRRGRVVTTVFATTEGGGLGLANATVRGALRRAGAPVDTRACEHKS
jgi:uncharacterized membrane protein required for colicin V production